MNEIAIGDGIHKDEIGPQDGDESNEENGDNEIPSILKCESNSGTIIKTEFWIAILLNKRGEWD